MMVKDYRGKNGERAIWKCDALLVSQINDVLKQVAMEEGQWAEKRDGDDQEAKTRVTIAMLNAGRDQVANHQNGCAGPLGTRTPDATELRRQSANETLLRPPKASHPIAFDREIAQSG